MPKTPESGDLAEWLATISEIHTEVIELGLDRVAEVFHKLPLVQQKDTATVAPKVITFAGTNGKGSTLAMVEALALAGDKKVGAYTSPHLLRFNERVRLNGADASDAQLSLSFTNVEKVRGKIPLTYFEFTTLAALDLFSRTELDYWLLEVGLGGRLDAVNIIDPDVAVITTIDLDHQEWLGPDRETIGFEKAGILRPGIPLVLGSTNMPQSVLQKASELVTNTFVLAEDFWLHQQQFMTKSRPQQIKEITLDLQTVPDLPPDNIATALQTACLMGLNLECLNSTPFPELKLQGRSQLISKHPAVVLDVAHNPHAARYMAGWLQRNPVKGPDIAVFSALKDKDVKGIVDALSDRFQQWHLFKINDVRAMPLALLQKYVVAGTVDPKQSQTAFSDPRQQPYDGQHGSAQDNDVKNNDGSANNSLTGVFAHPGSVEALTAAFAAAGKHGRILVFGSFMAVAAVLETGMISDC